ncbi:MAG: hypothetical protein PHT88_05610 [Candidatus Moranbacteria bacterium]|nr:hypothetical protein [Candidatus Moranbacteria bacterium]
MQKFNSKLSNYPRTHAFVAISTANIKGNTVEYWMNELKDITIVGQCNCGHCYTVYFENSKKNKAFTHEYPCVTNFGEVTVILTDKNDGCLSDIEVPQDDYVPYAEEYDSYAKGKSPLNETAEEAYTVVKQWFLNTPEVETFQLVVE